MKKASRIMYTLGVVFNIIGLILVITLPILGGIGYANPEEVVKQSSQEMTVEDVKAASLTLIIIGVIYIVVYLVVLILALHAKKAVKNDKRENAPHIIMIVIGAISVDVFYLLGGIFGLVSENQQN